MQRFYYLATLLFALQFSTSLAAETAEFTAAATLAINKYGTSEGRDYAARVIRSFVPALAKAMHACGRAEFKPRSFYDLVFVVSPAGIVRHVPSTPTTPFAHCIAAHLQLPASVSHPPEGFWSIQIRLLHGRKLAEDHDLPFRILSDDID